MVNYDIFFYGIIFFLIGVFAASLGLGFMVILVAVLLLAAIFLFLNQFKISGNLKILALLTAIVLFGAAYYKWDDAKFKDIKINFNKEINFSGLVIDDPQYGSGAQTLTIKLNEPLKGIIQAKLALYPQFYYGDEIKFQGRIKFPPGGSYADYLAKEKINSLVNFPKARLEKSGLGSKIKASLFDFKHSVIDSYYKVLPPSQASLLAGLNFGERAKFTADFKKAMSLSGTTHLTALSGQQIAIISAVIIGLLGYFFSPVLTSILAILIILSFVAMTGFELSVVRAAIMAGVVLLAKLAGRIYDPRNSIALAAFLIVLFNPKALVFDLGFQLSFLAVMGIIYLRPTLQKLLKIKDGPGFLAWRENFLMTLSAQLATAPLLIINFNNFSLFALLSNIMILMVIPLTMILGFIIGFVNFLPLVGYYLASVIGWLASLFLNYEIFVINFFAKIALPLNLSLSFWGVLAYYLALVGLIVFAGRAVSRGKCLLTNSK